MSVLWLNGALLEENEACLNVNDRGFRFGDGVFETIPVHQGIPYLWDYHIERLQTGLKALRIVYDTAHLRVAAFALIGAQSEKRGLLRLQISRGVGSRGYMPSPDCTNPTALMQWLQLPLPSDRSLKLWLSSYEKISSRALPVHCKLAQGLGSILARLEAQEQFCQDALQCTSEGHIAEASSSNIFWRKDNVLYTPSLTCGILAGVTRKRIMEITSYTIAEGQYSFAHLQGADAMVLTNASMGITPVESLDGHAGFQQSYALARELNMLRNNDIISYISNQAKSLLEFNL